MSDPWDQQNYRERTRAIAAIALAIDKLAEAILTTLTNKP
jgi:hypothetical protein